ncbi:MAG: diguanylate cyclase [Betaproteobacteria bacterium]|nr:diguanylate cyclase [Betaproteobacteria bacterium]
MKAGRKTLFGVLRYITFWSVVLTLLISSVVFTVTFFYTVRGMRDGNVMHLVRTVGYATEAAMMFGDRQTAGEILNNILASEEVCRITIYSGTGESGDVFAQATKPCGSTSAEDGKKTANTFLSSGAVRGKFGVDRDGKPLGVVEIVSDDAVFIRFLYRGAIVLGFCLILAVLMAHLPARWMERRFATELSSLSGMAHAARLEGDFTRRLPAFEIAEFNGLGQDFNALFSEIQVRNAELLLRQSHLETVNRTLSNQTMCDALTGLANRACLSEQLEIAISKARMDGTRVGVLYVDNDHFKDINENYGHGAGDALLVNVGKRLSGAVRESDLVARLGGDEFVILLAPVSGEDDLRHVSNKILSAMSRKLRLAEREGMDIELGVSIGMAVFPDQASNAVTLLRAADHAMYRAKRLGRGRACMYDPSIDAALEHEAFL